MAQSVGVYGGATVWIYALAYGDAGGQKLSASVPGLSMEPCGTGGNFGAEGGWGLDLWDLRVCLFLFSADSEIL